jgi:hypothetical protein
VEGAPCFQLQGNNPHGDSITLWIDKQSFLLRKISTASKVVGSDAVTTLRYHPQINPLADAKTFVSPVLKTIGHSN